MFKRELVRAHGYPQACVCCGNDEDDQLALRDLSHSSVGGIGCALLCLPFGPIVWLIAGVVYLATRSSRKIDVPVPVCKLCSQAAQKIGYRGAAILAIAGVIFALDALTVTRPLDVWLGFGAVLLGMYALSEYTWLSRSFQVKVLKANSQQVLVEVDNDDYPALYQRHLDSALLYGSSESTGTAG